MRVASIVVYIIKSRKCGSLRQSCMTLQLGNEPLNTWSLSVYETWITKNLRSVLYSHCSSFIILPANIEGRTLLFIDSSLFLAEIIVINLYVSLSR